MARAGALLATRTTAKGALHSFHLFAASLALVTGLAGVGLAVCHAPTRARAEHAVHELAAQLVSVAYAEGLTAVHPWSAASPTTADAIDEVFGRSDEQLTAPLSYVDVALEVLRERSSMSSDERWRTANVLVDESRRLGVDPLLVLAVIDVESKFDHRAVSYRGARGLMQLMPETRQWLIDTDAELSPEASRDDVANPESNVRLGVAYLARLSRGFSRIERMLQAYNCGPGRVAAILRGDAVLPEESKFFADRVLKRYVRLQREFSAASVY